jgi:alpha-beta hydrolase superfamily lysophospholipase
VFAGTACYCCCPSCSSCVLYSCLPDMYHEIFNEPGGDAVVETACEWISSHAARR